MAGESDTLNIGQVKLRKEFPIAQAQAIREPDPVIHAEAAAIARARIAAAPEHHPLGNPQAVPAAPTSDLITSKTALAGASYHTPLIHRGRKLPSALLPLLTAAGIFLLVLLLFKAPIIISQLQYSLANHPPAANNVVAPPAEVVPAENTLTIAKINVHAPVQYEPSVQEAAVQQALQDGVVHYGNTAVPGEAGNVAIFGHSSNDWWEPGNYKFVFVLLDKLSPGDQITMDYQAKRYTYEVTGSRVVEPTDVGVLNATAEPTLTLITCTPPGTSLRRLVVTAKQISPDPKGSTQVVVASPSSSAPATLSSSSASGFFDQLGQAWQGIVSGFSSLFGAGNSKSPSATPSQLPAIK